MWHNEWFPTGYYTPDFFANVTVSSSSSSETPIDDPVSVRLTCFRQLISKLKAFASDRLVFSGYQNISNVPYIYVQHQGNFFNSHSTCFTIEDICFFDIMHYGRHFTDLRKKADAVREEMKDFGMDGLLDTNMVTQINEQVTNEIYVVTQTYQFDIERTLDFTVRSFPATDNLFTSLYQGFLESAFVTDIEGFVTTEFVDEAWKRPFMYLDNVEEIQTEGRTTCHDEYRTTFDFVLQGFSPAALETIEEKIELHYNFQQLSISTQVDMLRKKSNVIIEIEPNIWENRITYEMLKQEALV